MRIVCLGDSLTYGYGVPRKDTWVALAAQGETEYHNKGVNGDTTGGMLARFSDDVLSFSPDAVLVMGGANDRFFSGSFAAAKANLMALCHRCCAHGVIPLVGIPIPLCPPIREGWAELIDTSFFSEYEIFCTEIAHMAGVFGFGVVDFRKAFAGRIKEMGEPASAFYLADGLHPNTHGHRILADIVRQALAELL